MTRTRLKLWLKRLLFGIAALITLVALTLSVEHYRAKRLWLAYQSKLVAQGEKLRITDFPPPDVPAEDNFAMTPLLRPLTEYTVDPQTGEALFLDPDAVRRLRRLFLASTIRYDSGPGWRLGQVTRLDDWQQVIRSSTNNTDPAVQALRARPQGPPADDLLFLLGQEQTELNELRAALQRPAANFRPPADYSPGPWSVRTEVVKRLSRTLQLAALSELATGQTETAAADVVALLRLADLGAGDPILIGALVRFALVESSIQPLWEGLAQHRWTDTQLQAFEQALGKIQPVQDMLVCLRGERAYSLNLLNHIPYGFGRPTSNWRRIFLGPIIYQNQRRTARDFQDVLYPAFNVDAGTVDVAALQAVPPPQIRLWAPYRALADALLPALLPCGDKTARTQATVNLAHLAIALERFRLGHGTYPPDLQTLCPDFLTALPLDPVTGEPPLYRQDSAGPHLHYRGLDGKDEGGLVTVISSGNAKDDLQTGDWVWQYEPVTQIKTLRMGK